ncbi:AAA family ATPase [Roseibacillus ishigakijimensis]|uniref:MoxR family ATPase n=1 Tax=Roseibacillus ishigakijimensis TaxID=454146 RepID=A0A934RLJ4_9BACT|nr:MoxR family ATPase [Roseibacillus ishigakijimensis]MBK1832990.1 MoxR family ATPase [Roseibacillus ishigakijimensis]
MTTAEATATLHQIESAIATVIRGQEKVVRQVLACLVSGGHLLLEDYPGTGKTTLAKALALTINGMAFKRLQFTPDLLPSDVLGVSIFDPSKSEFRFHQGPIFTDLLLADEINRASPRTQSALLEAMAEGQTTIEGRLYDLGQLFFVVATQNPVEFRGTYPLPEAQMDRFAMQCDLGYLSVQEEVVLLAEQQTRHPLDDLGPVCSREDLLAIRRLAREVYLSDEVRHYIVSVVSATREAEKVKLPASPRASLALMHTAQAMALLAGKDFVTPEMIQDLAVPVIAHRLVLEPDAKFAGLTPVAVVEQILADTPLPV